MMMKYWFHEVQGSVHRSRKTISVAGGALKVKDELQFLFEMVLRKQA
jgi:hypothetical protein